MRLRLNPLSALLPWRGRDPHASELYGAIVAQARLPVFYQQLGVPDTPEGRFLVLSLHLFAVLHRLKGGGAEAAAAAQALADRFTADMETVLRQMGVGDLSIPKKMRKLVASSASLLQTYEEAYGRGGNALEHAIARALPCEVGQANRAAACLTPYVREVVGHLCTQPLQEICRGAVKFPPLGDDHRRDR